MRRLLAPLLAGLVVAVTLEPKAPGQEPPRFTAESQLVVLHVTVKDRTGSYISGLDTSAFRVLEENRAQLIRFFAHEDAPVTVGLVLDSSGSMRAVRDRVIAASAAFVASSNPDDEVFALVFNDDVRPVLASETPFTNEAATLESALVRGFAPAGRTALHDAIAEGLRYTTLGTRDRRALVLLSDGGDNASQATFADVLARTQASNVVIYTVALIDPNDPDASPGRLKQLAVASGGLAFTPRDVAEVDRAFEQIARDIRYGYTLAYEPSASNPHAGLHRIRVEVQTSDGRRLVTRTRSGYLAAPANERGHAR